MPLCEKGHSLEQGRGLPVGSIQINKVMSAKTTIKKTFLNPERWFIAFFLSKNEKSEIRQYGY